MDWHNFDQPKDWEAHCIIKCFKKERFWVAGSRRPHGAAEKMTNFSNERKSGIDLMECHATLEFELIKRSLYE